MRVWMDLRAGQPHADRRCRAVGRAHPAAPDLPELELERVQGRLIWKTRPGRLELSARDSDFRHPGRPAAAAGRYSLRALGAGGGPDARFEVEFDALDVAAVTRLVDRIPVDEALRARLAELQPSGTVRSFRVSWRGAIKDSGEYALSGAFEHLAVHASGYVPGFAAVNGTLAADQHGGTLTLHAGASSVDMPRVFVEPLPLEALNAKVTWSMPDGLPLVRLESLAFSSAHMEGSLAGTYQAQAEGPGRVDLAGGLARAEGAQAWRYIPLTVHEDVRKWLQTAILGGQMRDVRLTLRGELQRFPFSDGTSGVFEVVSRLENGTLAYAPAWPALEEISGQLLVRAHRLSVQVDSARVFGAHIGKANAVVPDLGSHEPQLQVQAEAEGPTADFLRFIAQSPIEQRLDGFARSLQASGRGRLVLSLEVPLKHSVDAQVTGHYHFADNVLVGAPRMPRLDQLGGVLSFTRDGINVRDGSVRVLGMPARFTLDPRPGGGVVVRGTGRAEMAGLRQELALPWMVHLAGATDWSATVLLAGESYDLVVESNLRGVTSALPAPLSKPPLSPLSFRLERRPRGADQDLIVFAVGSILSGQLAYSRGDSVRVTQGELRLGAQAPAPERDGVWLAGNLDSLDLDQWYAVLGKPEVGDRSGLAGLDLSAASAVAYSRNWTNVQLEARRTESAWQASVTCREATGTLTWAPGGQGSLVGRFPRLFVPVAGSVLQAITSTATERDLPSMDVIVDDFRVGERQLGRLVVRAVPDRTDWRIETLDLHSPEGRLSMSGVWRPWAESPATRMDVRVEVADIGRYFASLKLPEGIKGGSGRLEGQLSWSGPPYALDLPTLSGTLTVEAKNGQFVRVEPGIGKLIGVLSLQALPRRVTLDFRDIFSQGFRFDDIRASGVIQRGVVHTDNFRMTGTSARVDMKGDLDLARETQALEVKVVPSLSESVALGAAIVNPAVGLATLFAQKALKDPINQMVAVEYLVTGTWADPLVANKRREPVDDGKRGRQ